jgi:hypothetical protein
VDIDEMDVGRLCNLVYATLVDEPGAFSDRGEVREQLDSALKRAASPKKGRKVGPLRRVGMSAAAAKRMQSDADEYDSKIRGGRLRD